GHPCTSRERITDSGSTANQSGPGVRRRMSICCKQFTYRKQLISRRGSADYNSRSRTGRPEAKPPLRRATMSVQVREETGGKLLAVKISGKLTKEDYQHFVPVAERLIQQHKKIRILCQLQDFHGWEMGALWEDIKFDIKHFAHIERLALVGETRW